MRWEVLRSLLQSISAWFFQRLGGGDTLNCRPPDQGNLTIGEIPIPIIQGEIPVSTSMDRKPGQCFSKTSVIPSMLVKSAHIRKKI